MSFKANGLDGLRSALSEYPDEIRDEVRKTFYNFGNRMVRHAQIDHEFVSDSNEAEKSITIKVPKEKLGLIFFIDESRTKVGEYAYPVILHEGSFNGYRKSKSAPSLPHKSPKKGFGILADHFMDRAWDKYIEPMMEDTEEAIIRAGVKVGII